MNYQEFLKQKHTRVERVGFEVNIKDLNPLLFPFQRDIVRWALQRGRAAIFADCGLGKTPMQLEWASQVCKFTGGNVLIFAPLAVNHQTAKQGEKFNIPVTVCRTQDDVRPGINIANYEMMPHFDPSSFAGLVIDESSILKGNDSKTRIALNDFSAVIPYRLANTATPAPNDIAEIINHAEFLNIMSGNEILALFFKQDGNTTHKWRLKGHAEEDFWKWLGSWAVAFRKPSDLGYPDDNFTLPPLNIHQIVIETAEETEETLFKAEALTLTERRDARRGSLSERVRQCAEMVNNSTEPFIIWCNLNSESEALAASIPDAVEVRGDHSKEHKTNSMLGFSDGSIRVLVTKPSICGFGMNWQHCKNVAFVGLSDSYEQFYQAVRRCWRFGQIRPVECHVITSDLEGAVVRNIQAKEAQAKEMFDSLIKHMGTNILQSEREEMNYQEDCASGRGWTAYKGDCVKMLSHVKENSVGLSVFSPPFPGMYAYTNSVHDMGNVKNIDEMVNQFKFLLPELLRVTMPGRSACIHLTQAVAFKGVDGYIGLKDFRGRVIAAMEEAGWIYYGEVCIDKDPQVKAIRTKDRGLLFKTLATDSAHMHMALADYLLQFRKPGENPEPIKAGTSERYNNAGWITPDEWIEWAAPVWYRQSQDYPGGIRETDVLNVAAAREPKDERHLCPLQLGVIERAVKLWSNPGDTVLSPFMGIGSEGVVSLQLDRQFIGVELKESYFNFALQNLTRADIERSQTSLFDFLEESAELSFEEAVPA